MSRFLASSSPELLRRVGARVGAAAVAGSVACCLFGSLGCFHLPCPPHGGTTTSTVSSKPVSA